MASNLKNLSEYSSASVPDASKMKFGIVVAEWNEEITGALLNGAMKTLLKHNALPGNIIVKTVPGSFELPLGAQLLMEHDYLDAVICLGCVIRGETPHFDYICQAVSKGIMQLNLDYSIPVIFGVLTTNDFQQALDRAGGRHGNKGDEAAVTALKMAGLQSELEAGSNSSEPII
jgi:6,7-dimethyl-8-ribityllumazine synthase